MTPERYRRIGALFDAALERAEAERPAFLAQICAGEEHLRLEVERLLENHVRSETFLSAPAETPLLSEYLPDVIGPYSICKQLGEGGMGIVYLAHQSDPIQRDVALKVIRPGMGSKGVITRFESERRTLAMMAHPYIAQVYDAGTSSRGLPYFAMELVDGVSITVYCQQEQLAIRDRIVLFLKVCQAIQYAHQKGIIHRDIKPSNILVRKIEGQPIPKVIDFGLAKALDAVAMDASVLTHVGTIVGTLTYMSPEQADLSRQRDIDTRSDLYSLGVLLYELLTGETPLDPSQFPNDGYLNLLQRIQTDEPQPPSARVKTDLDRELDWICLKAIAKDPQERFETVNGLGRDLERYLANEPVEAAPPSNFYRTRKFVRKHRLAIGIAATFALVLTVALVVTTWMTVRARRAELEANAVNDFLRTGVLAQADPGNQTNRKTAPDSNLTVRTALDRAAAGVSGKFPQQPLVEAAIRQTICDAYQGLGLYAKAQEQAQKVYDLRRRALGEKKRSTLNARATLAHIATVRGNYREAEPLLADLLATRKTLFGSSDPDTIQSLAALGESYQLQGKQQQAVDLLNQAATAASRVLGPEHRDTIYVLENLASTYFEMGKYRAGEQVAARVLDVRRETLGKDHPDTLRSMSLLAIMYQSEKNHTPAENLYKKEVAAQRRLYGVAHPDTLRTIYDLALLYDNEKRYPEAAALYEENLAARGKVWPRDHPRTLRLLGALAHVYEKTARTADARRLYEEAFAGQQRALGDGHPDTLRSGEGVARLCAATQPARAETLLRQAAEGFRRKLGARHPETMSAVLLLAQFWVEQKEFKKAESLLREELDSLAAIKADDELDYLMYRYRMTNLLGYTLAAQGRWEVAEPLLVEGYKGLLETASVVEDQDEVEDAGKRLLEAYERWSKEPAKTGEWKKRVEANRLGLAALKL